MELSIIVTSYKSVELVKVCLDSIKRNCALTDYELIVTDSETDEKMALMMREDYQDIKFFPFNRNVGFQELVKKGIEESRGEYILILNADIIIKKGSVEKLLEFVKSYPEVGIAGPRLINFNETLQYSCFRFYTPLTIIYRRTFLGKLKIARKHLDNFLMKDFDHQSKKEVDWIMGSAMITSRRAIEKVGLMDPRFRMYLEDTDWCRRFWENGYKVVYFPEPQMYHYHGRGSAGKSVLESLMFNRLTWIHIASALKYFIKYQGKALPRHG